MYVTRDAKKKKNSDKIRFSMSRRIARALRTGARVGAAGANGGGVLREGCTQGGSIAASVTTGACTLPGHPARAAVQADGRRRQRGATVGRHGRRP